MCCWVVQGAFQAWVYPLCLKLVSANASERLRNSVWGLWVTCQHVGGMLGTLICAQLSQLFGWRYAFFAPSVWVMMAGALMRILPDAAAPSNPASASPRQKPSLLLAVRLPHIKELGVR